MAASQRGSAAHRHKILLSILLQARLAQLVERKALNLVVVGSSPTVGVLFSLVLESFGVNGSNTNSTTVGLEPTIFGSEDRRLIHWATRPVALCRKTSLIWSH